MEGEAADLLAKQCIQIAEATAKLAGSGAKNLVAFLYALSKNPHKLQGKTKMQTFIKGCNGAARVFPIRKEDIREFGKYAKQYKLLWAPIKEKGAGTVGDHLRPLGMLVMLNALENRVVENKAKGRFTRIYIDEGYLYFLYQYSAQVLYKFWKRLRKLGGMMTLITQNVEECLRSDTARLMFANSEFLVMLNQAPTDRAELARLLHISDTQLSAITNADVGCGLIKVGGSIVPFRNEFPKDTELYRLMSTTLGEK